MNMKRITGIVPVEMLDTMERHLRAAGVPGITVERVRGYGEHPNYFRRDLMQENVRLVLYSDADSVDRIVSAIADCARDTGLAGGVVTVDDIERLIHLTNDSDGDPA